MNIDPCMGSGHILVYAFDVLYDIYKSAGYSEREIPKLILEKNLYGLEIDDRAAQLAYFAVMMKARNYKRRIFRERINLNICSIQESNEFPKEAIDFLVNSKETEIEKRIHREDVEYLINIFNDAKEYGSILDVKEIDFDAIERRVEEIRYGDTTDIFELQYKNVILDKVPALMHQAKIMSQKYDVVCTNPPYMGDDGMNSNLSNFLKTNYPLTKYDMFAVFIEKSIRLCKNNRYSAIITQHSWMFLYSYEKLRKKIFDNYFIASMAHLGPRAFEEISGEVVQTTSFVISKSNCNKYKGTYKRLVNYGSCLEKEKAFFNMKNTFNTVRQNKFKEIAGSPLSYWISGNVINAFLNNNRMGCIMQPMAGICTGNNNKYIRQWYEIDFNTIGFKYKDRNEVLSQNKHKWFVHNKGGSYRKWYGNLNLVINYTNDSIVDMEHNAGFRHDNREFYFKRGLTWSKMCSNKFSIRYLTEGAMFDSAGTSAFPNNEDIYYILGILNSKLTAYFLMLLNPTMAIYPRDVSNIPYAKSTDILINKRIDQIVQENIHISRSEWNTYETSWGFLKHPLITFKNNGETIEQVFNNWSIITQKQFNQLKCNEENLNTIFIDIYKLEDELTPDIEDKDVTIRKADRVHDVKSFISYSVGCMFGRYSLDEEGLIFAGGQFNPDRYKTFKVDIDNVIPITDDEYFEDDIVSRFVEFVKITFSEESLEENLDYIADALGKKGNETSRQTIRRYFLKDFYKDHLQTYQKKPIYWLFDSGKNDGFKALIYMHRYDIGTVSRVRTDYLHLLQRKYVAEVNRLDMVMENSSASIREKTEARKKNDKIQRQMIECAQYDQVIAHIANEKISIDLDDGVNVNYTKFQGVEVPQGEGKKPLKADLLAKI